MKQISILRVLTAAMAVAALLMVPQVAAAQTPTVTAGQNVTKIGVTAATQGATEQTTAVTATVKAATAAAGSTVRITAGKPAAGKVARLKLTKTEAAETKVPVTNITVSEAPDTEKMVNKMWKMIATVEPENATDKSVTWSIDDGDGTIATINTVTGVVTGKGQGQITVRATANDDSGKSGEMGLFVSGGGPSDLPAIYISSDVGYNIKAGESLPLEAYNQSGELLNNNGATWSLSYNPNNAGVITNGVFSAEEAGEYTVVATYGGNTGYRIITVEGSATGQETINDDPGTGIAANNAGTISGCDDNDETEWIKESINECINIGNSKDYFPEEVRQEIGEDYVNLIEYTTVWLMGSFDGDNDVTINYSGNYPIVLGRTYRVVLACPNEDYSNTYYVYEATCRYDGSLMFTMPASVARTLADKAMVIIVYSD